MSANWNPLDQPLLTLVDNAVIWFQNTTGVPKFRVVQIVSLTYSAAILFSSGSGHNGAVTDFLLSSFIWSIFVVGRLRKEQQIADRTMQPVPNRFWGSFAGSLFRLVLFSVAAVATFSGKNTRFFNTPDLVLSVAGLVCVYLMSTSTWPVNRSRVRLAAASLDAA